MAGMLERRPSATKIESGNAIVIDTTVSITVSGSPPHWSLSTRVRPSMPPLMSTKYTTSMTSQMGPSQRFQKRGMQLMPTTPSMSAVAITGRQCSVSG
ncbi:hypothetical protein D9M69_702360 [compost metagenome]